jgi:enoyl-CoA hydratase/carnithine racemase
VLKFDSVMNSLTPDIIEALGGTFESLSSDPEVRVVILTGAGDKAFSAGVDLTKAGESFFQKKKYLGIENCNNWTWCSLALFF